MSLSEYLMEAVASRKTNKYGLLGDDEPTVNDLTELLESLGYELMPAYLNGNLTTDYVRAQYMGERKYFTYRDRYSTQIVVGSDKDKEHNLSFRVMMYGLLGGVLLIGKDGKTISVHYAKKEHKDFVKMVKDFLGL